MNKERRKAVTVVQAIMLALQSPESAVSTFMKVLHARHNKL